jgi:transcriptional regulator with XRE-family HTH domain
MMITSVDPLRELVRRRRKELGLTQKDAAALVGYTQKWLTNFETGKADPPASMLIKMTNLLGIRLNCTLTEISSSELGPDEREIDFDMDLSS